MACHTRCGWFLLAVFAAAPMSAGAGETVIAPARQAETRGEVLLTLSPGLSSTVRTMLLQEAAAIWRQQHVTIVWLPPADDLPPAGNRLRALVVERPSRAHRRAALGELVRTFHSHPIALISIDRAERLLASARGSGANEPLAVSEQRLGIMLGRALAHEIGHFLLDTHTHARRGLMRPHFDAIEFTDLREGTFALDEAAAAWLRAGGVEKFAYAAR
jgi:hypothetical protein